jgi:tetratricopeptide (TPR) repeat protein
MSRQTAGWSVGFAATAAMAGLLLLATCRAGGEALSVAKRDPAGVTDVELELILNKIREGDLRSIRGDASGATSAWGEARRLGEGLWPIHEGLGDSYARAKRYDDAIREYSTAAPLVPDKHGALKAGILLKRGDLQALAGRPIEAVKGYLEAGAPAAAAGRIVEQALKGDREAALGLLRRRAETHDPRFWSVVAMLLDRLERRGEAAEALARFCIAVSPWDEALDRQAVERLRAEKKYDLAVDVCRAWARSTPQSIAAYQLMGDLHREAGREREALIAYTSIVDVRPGDAGAHRALGEIFKGLNRVDDAISQYELARKARPEDQVTYGALAALYEAKGDEAKAEDLSLEANRRFGGSSVESRGRLVQVCLSKIERLKAAGKADELKALREKYVAQGIGEADLYDLKVVMTWDAQAHIDLDVEEPGGEKVNHDHDASKQGGKYHMHNTSGFGPETYTLRKAASGTYRIGAHRHDGNPANVKFVVILFEGTPREERREAAALFKGENQDVMKVVLEVRVP